MAEGNLVLKILELMTWLAGQAGINKVHVHHHVRQTRGADPNRYLIHHMPMSTASDQLR